jgi:WD40 repeat protein
MDSTRTAKSVSMKKNVSCYFISIDLSNDFSYFLSASVDKTIGLWKGRDEDVGHTSFNKRYLIKFSSKIVYKIYFTCWTSE